MYGSKLHSSLLSAIEDMQFTRTTRYEDNFRNSFCSHLSKYISPDNINIPSTTSAAGDISVHGRTVELKYSSPTKRIKIEEFLADLRDVITGKKDFAMLSLRFDANYKFCLVNTITHKFIPLAPGGGKALADYFKSSVTLKKGGSSVVVEYNADGVLFPIADIDTLTPVIVADDDDSEVYLKNSTIIDICNNLSPAAIGSQTINYMTKKRASASKNLSGSSLIKKMHINLLGSGCLSLLLHHSLVDIASKCSSMSTSFSTSSYLAIKKSHQIDRSAILKIDDVYLHVDVVGSAEDGIVTLLYKIIDEVVFLSQAGAVVMSFTHTTMASSVKLASYELVDLCSVRKTSGASLKPIENSVSFYDITM